MTTQEFCSRHGIRVRSVERIWENPHNPDWKDADHYRITLQRPDNGKRRSFTVYFSQGYGHNGRRPKAHDILECLAMDANALEKSFKDWCDDYGFDTDSRKAEHSYQVTRQLSQRLERFLGSTLLGVLQECEE